MESRERVIRAIKFLKPDRSPISRAILPSAQYEYGKGLSEIINSFHEDFVWHLLPELPREKLSPLYKAGKHSDDFGTLWFVTVEGRCGIPVVYPIKPDLSGYSSEIGKTTGYSLYERKDDWCSATFWYETVPGDRIPVFPDLKSRIENIWEEQVN